MEYKRLPHKLIGGLHHLSLDSKLRFSELEFYFYILFSKTDLFYSFEGKILHLIKINRLFG